MKRLLTFVLMICSLTTFAARNELECEGEIAGKKLFLEVEESTQDNASLKRAILYIWGDGAERSIHFSVKTRVDSIFRSIDFSSSGLRLEINYGPLFKPRLGWTYSGLLLTTAVKNQEIEVNCIFPNAY